MSGSCNGAAAADFSPCAKKILRVFATNCPAFLFIPENTKLEREGWEEVFPGIDSDGPARAIFLRGVRQLEDEGIVKVIWKRGGTGEIVKKLRIENLRTVYRVLGEENPWYIYAACEKMLENWEPAFACGKVLRDYFLECLREPPRPLPVRSEEEMKDLITIIDLKPDETRGRGVQELSAGFPGGAGRFISLLKIADRLCHENIGTVLSGRLGIAGIPESAVFSLRGEMYLYGGVFYRYAGDPARLPGCILERAECFRFSSLLPVICVQDLKSFYPLVKQYTRGMNGFIAADKLHAAAAKLLELVGRTEVPLYFFGDIDPEGLRIFQECRRICGPGVRPLSMDAETYRKNLRYGYPLSGPQMDELRRVDMPELADLQREMLNEGLGVKQEYLRLSRLSL